MKSTALLSALTLHIILLGHHADGCCPRPRHSTHLSEYKKPSPNLCRTSFDGPSTSCVRFFFITSSARSRKKTTNYVQSVRSTSNELGPESKMNLRKQFALSVCLLLIVNVFTPTDGQLPSSSLGGVFDIPVSKVLISKLIFYSIERRFCFRLRVEPLPKQTHFP